MRPNFLDHVRSSFSSLEAAIETAKLIAQKSPVAVQTTKQSLIYSRDNTVNDGLEHIVSCNHAPSQGGDHGNFDQSIRVFLSGPTEQDGPSEPRPHGRGHGDDDQVGGAAHLLQALS